MGGTITLQILKYAIDNECPYYTEITSLAAQSGHLHVLEFLHQRGLLVGGIAYAIKGNAPNVLAVLERLREYGSAIDEDACLLAAESGNLAVLKWARENGMKCQKCIIF